MQPDDRVLRGFRWTRLTAILSLLGPMLSLRSVRGAGCRFICMELSSPPTALPEPALTAVLNDLAKAQTEVWLVLDDYHFVDGSDVSKGLIFWLEHLPL